MFRVLLIIVCCLFTTVENVYSQKQYDFESLTNNWSSNSQWEIGTKMSFSGTSSLSYRIPENANTASSAIQSIETGYTIQKVRHGNFKGESVIIASSYDGKVMAISFSGIIQWKNDLSGFMVHDIWCSDLDKDGSDEVLVANADGGVYCLDSDGSLLWKFQKNEVPMYSVVSVQKNGANYVVAGGLDLSIYYISTNGSQVKELKSSSYSEEKVWGGTNAPNRVHYANFLRSYPKDANNDILVMHASNNHMQDRGAIYLFDVLENDPLKRVEVSSSSVIGDLRITDYNNDGDYEVMMGASGHHNDVGVSRLNLSNDVFDRYELDRINFGYSVAQSEIINDAGTKKYMILRGDRMFLLNLDLEESSEQVLASAYSYWDMYKVPNQDKVVFASSQSGGSQIHIINTQDSDWKTAYQELVPKGKLEKIIKNTDAVRTAIASYSKPAGERDPLKVYLMTESTSTSIAASLYNSIRQNYDSPIFLGGDFMGTAEDWDRSSITNAKFREKRDSRRRYVLTQNEAVSHITNWYNQSEGRDGIAYWGGHGNDPYMFQLSTTQKVLDQANGKKTVLIYPELEDHSDDFAWVMEDLFYPLAAYSKTKNANIFVRTKHNFWQGNVYLPMWKRMLDGEFADVFVPSMEETTDKAMDISIASRTGLWASGAVNSWGTRAVPDNPSFDRSRQFCHQRLPNHFLRHIIYHLSNGAQYINNFPLNPDYMSVFWNLIAKGALYVPKPNELLSVSPVHLSMVPPDDHYMEESSSLKWSTYYNEEFENNNPFVFSRQNATWPGAQVTPWDFSKYAGNVKDRRQNYLPNYPNGLVLITPPQDGSYKSTTAKRNPLKDNLHPIYKNIMKEYYTDGRYYYSKDGAVKYSADQYYKEIEKEIKEGAKKIPVTVEGEVAWTLAQTSPTNLRLTIIDGGYLNPEDRVAKVTFNTIQPLSVTDVLDGKTFGVSGTVDVDIPCGAFRFIDIKLNSPLN